MCLLVCEPDPDVLSALVGDLVGVNVTVVASSDGARALLDAGRMRPDLVLLGAMLPVVDSAVVVRTLRQVSDGMVIVGAGEGQAESVSAAIAAGADRVMARPYVASELRDVMLGLRGGRELDKVMIRAGSLTVDPLAYEVRLRGRPVPMSARELEVLVYLIRHQDRVVGVDELQQAVWAGDRLSSRSNAVAVTVLHLRARLEDAGEETIIRTIRRRGYRFYPPTNHRASATPSAPATPSATINHV